jgi:hypothetical protein
MKFSTIVAPLALVSAALAMPGPPRGGWGGLGPLPSCPPSNCLTQADANDIVAKFISLLDHPDIAAANATAQALIGPDFFEKSVSVSWLHPQSVHR